MRLALLLLSLWWLPAALPAAAPLTLDEAVARALEVDPRLEARRQEVAKARALVAEVDGHLGARAEFNGFVGISPAVRGSPFTADPCGGSGNPPCTLRRDRYSLEQGLSPWLYTQFTIVKPITTFGKVDPYREAARANVRVKTEAVRLTRGEIRLQVGQAYFGYLAARDGAAFLRDARRRVEKAERLIQRWLDTGEGEATPADLYAIQAGGALVDGYLAEAEGLQRVAEAALRLLVRLPEGTELALAERRLTPLPPPADPLDTLRRKALRQRPEMVQLEAGLEARRALVKANKLAHRPNLYIGVAGTLSHSPGRESLDNPYVYDPFNDYGMTPVVGLQWDWQPELQKAKVDQARAELEALIAEGEFARRGIPFEVAEQYHQAEAARQAVERLEAGARAARRWLVATYTDFEAGLKPADKLATAFQAYVLAYSQYLQTVYRYNMHRLRLDQVTGAYP